MSHRLRFPQYSSACCATGLGFIGKHEYSSNRPSSFNIFFMIYITKYGDPNRNSICIWHAGWYLLHSIRVYLLPIELCINLSLILHEAVITYDLEFHVVLEVTKYSKHSATVSLTWCSIVSIHGRHIEVHIKPPKGHSPIGASNYHPVHCNFIPYK